MFDVLNMMNIACHVLIQQLVMNVLLAIMPKQVIASDVLIVLPDVLSVKMVLFVTSVLQVILSIRANVHHVLPVAYNAPIMNTVLNVIRHMFFFMGIAAYHVHGT